MAEGAFNNAVLTAVEEMSDDEFQQWIHKQQNAIATNGAGGGVSKPARMLMSLAVNQYLSSAKILRELSLLEVSRTAGKLTRVKKREMLPMYRDGFENSRKLFNFALVNLKSGLSVAAEVFEEEHDSLTKEERRRLEKIEKKRRVEKGRRPYPRDETPSNLASLGRFTEAKAVCYKCQGVGHFARNCTARVKKEKKRKRAVIQTSSEESD